MLLAIENRRQQKILLGSYDEGDGMGKKVLFGLKNYVQIYYSSQVLSTVDSNWGSLLPKPPCVITWMDAR